MLNRASCATLPMLGEILLFHLHFKTFMLPQPTSVSSLFLLSALPPSPIENALFGNGAHNQLTRRLTYEGLFEAV